MQQFNQWVINYTPHSFVGVIDFDVDKLEYLPVSEQSLSLSTVFEKLKLSTNKNSKNITEWSGWKSVDFFCTAKKYNL